MPLIIVSMLTHNNTFQKTRVRSLLPIFFVFAAFSIPAIYFLAYSEHDDSRQRFVQEDRINLQECEEHPIDFENYEHSQRYRCYADKTVRATSELGIAEIIHALKDYFQTAEGRPLEGATAHVLSHVIGESAVSSGVKNEDILKECGNFATGGCLNGAAHVYILTTQDVRNAETFCNSADVDNKIRMACYHGIGHGVTEYLRLDIKRGLSMCDRLHDRAGRYECGHAILMDLNSLFYVVSPPIPSDILKFCSGLDGVYKDTCYEFAGALEYAGSKNTRSALSVCSKTPERLKDRCMNRVIEILLYTTPRSERPSIIAATCAFAEKQAARICFYGAVQASIFTIGAAVGEETVAICDKAPTWLQKDCYLKIADSLLNEYGEDVRNKFCKEVMPNSYKKECE